ncbi:GPI anchored [Fusarium albosuccineum]|uniref:GPI anchored n=1 Tax=Fusarium albosuccineum TaxID=1237068 RepID=A0A8H4LLT7_9HYPO|nr:GPI anchored [Fusarium albosuccineum]
MAHGHIFLLLSFISVVFAFTHPGLLVTDADISRIKAKLAAKKEPWQSSWDKLTSIPFSEADYEPNAVSQIFRSENGELLWHDAAAAFNLALRWKITGDDQFADTASNILVAWSKELESLTGGGDDAYLTAGLQGYELANAAELLRDYEPFAKDQLPSFVSMMNSIFLPMNLDFLNHVLGSQHNVKHFFANWELCNIASALAVAVLTDNQTVWDFAVDYFKHGEGNGGINNAITNIVDEPGTGKPLGQGQEAGRDQGHSAMNYQLLGVIGQQAWNQGEDLFAYNESRILLGAEYFARYNLDHDVPFEPYTNGIVSFDVISPASRGAIRPAWELLYAHYVQIKGLDAPWTTAYLNNTLDFFGGFEGGAGSWGEGSGHYDGLGWGSLLHHLDEDDVKAASQSALTGSDTPTTGLPTAATDTLPSRPASTLITTSATTAVTTSDAPDTTTQATSSVHVKYGETKSLHSDTEPTSTTARASKPTSTKVRTGCAARRAHVQRA